jgi:serine/threonine protein phosphatase PrpC
MNDSNEKVSVATTETKAVPDDTLDESEAVVKQEEATAPLTVESENVEEARSEVKEKKEGLSAAGEWRVIGETVPGASHLRAGVPNQDALLQVRASSVHLPIILSISDGHGSNKCFRSDRGSLFAVHLASALLNKTLIGARSVSDIEKPGKDAQFSLPDEVVRRWRKVVEADLRQDPFQEVELARLVEKDGERARELVEANPYHAYGATLLVVALTPSFIIYMQLGDGEILTVSDTGEVTQPLSDDARLLANETTSLCLEGAADDFRFHLQPLAEPLPALILLTTDGYANSFTTTEGFHKVGSDLLEMMRSDGFDSVNRSVKGWLEEATASGSGDDCTLAVIVRMEAIEGEASIKSALQGVATNGVSDDLPATETANTIVAVGE